MNKLFNIDSNQKLKVGLAGTTTRSLQSIKSLLKNENFELSWVITPEPKKVGRKQILRQNPVHQWALDNHHQTILIEKKIEATAKEAIAPLPVDILLVVDFGYIIPEWLINFANIGAINIHPSKLPRWRGSSPAQFCILFGDKESATSLIEVTRKLDAGSIIHQQSFEVQPNWNSENYYTFAFNTFLEDFSEIALKYAQGKISPTTQPQFSPTPIARQLQKDDAFIDWKIIEKLISPKTTNTQNNPAKDIDWGETSFLIQHAAQANNQPLEQIVDQAARAFSPWPVLWTVIPTSKGNKRMKILSVEINKDQLMLKQVQIEGKQPTTWNEIKNIWQKK